MRIDVSMLLKLAAKYIRYFERRITPPPLYIVAIEFFIEIVGFPFIFSQRIKAK